MILKQSMDRKLIAQGAIMFSGQVKTQVQLQARIQDFEMGGEFL